MKFNLLILMLVFGCSNPKNVNTDKVKNPPMSSNFLNLISIDPSFLPTENQQKESEKFVKALYPKSNIEVNKTEQIEFVDQGENFESVSCNLCGKEINIDDWSNAMEKASSDNFVNLIFTTPCCRKTTSLNELKYEKPAGFSKFVISINGADQEPENEKLIQLEKILNTKLKIIWTHI